MAAYIHLYIISINKDMFITVLYSTCYFIVEFPILLDLKPIKNIGIATIHCLAPKLNYAKKFDYWLFL